MQAPIYRSSRTDIVSINCDDLNAVWDPETEKGHKVKYQKAWDCFLGISWCWILGFRSTGVEPLEGVGKPILWAQMLTVA